MTKCFTGVNIVPLALGHAEVNEPVSVAFAMTSPFTGAAIPQVGNPPLPSKFFLNNRSVPYPVVAAPSNWGPYLVNGKVPPPVSGRPGETAWVYTQKTCAASETTNLNNASLLGAALTSATPINYPNPGPAKTATPTATAALTTFDAHHIKPSCFGGSNLATNGVWLPNDNAKVNIHQIFSTWFYVNGASLVGANFTP